MGISIALHGASLQLQGIEAPTDVDEIVWYDWGLRQVYVLTPASRTVYRMPDSWRPPDHINPNASTALLPDLSRDGLICPN